MNTCELRFPGYDAASQCGWIQWELFLHRDVRAVRPTARADTLVVVHRGEPAVEAWCETLRAAGFPAAPR